MGHPHHIRKIEIDHDHGGIVKLNPLADWSQEEVWDYVREYNVPDHRLYAKGYTSIGCAPLHPPDPAGEPRAPAAGGGSRARPGMRDALLDRDRGFEHESRTRFSAKEADV